MAATSTTSSTPYARPPASGKGWRLEAKRLALTYPKCSLPRDRVAVALRAVLDVEWIVVAQEKHEDGDFHLHCAVLLNKQLRTRDSRLMDIEGHHPNIKVMTNVRGWLTYLTKEDSTPYAYGVDVQAILAKKEGKFDIIAKRLSEVHSIQQIYTDDPGFVMRHRKMMEDH